MYIRDEWVVENFQNIFTIFLDHCQTKPTTDWVILPLSHKSDFYKELSSSFVMFSFLTFWKMHLTKQWTFSECSALQLQIQLFDLQRIHHLCGGQLWTAPFSIVLKVSLKPVDNQLDDWGQNLLQGTRYFAKSSISYINCTAFLQSASSCAS